MSGRKLTDSPVLKKDEKRGMHLFAEVWRTAYNETLPDGKSVFASCFGKRYRERWHPLANAIYYEEKQHADTDYILNQARIYHCRDGSWQVERYDRMYFHPERLKAFLHETERILRLYLKTGRSLRRKPDEAWASGYAETVVNEDQKAMLEAARPKISINLSSLAKIRQDADITRDSLMTEEEMDASKSEETEVVTSSIAPAEERQEGASECRFALMDALHSRILMMLLNGEEISGILREKHLMPSVAADTINAALFDEIGDNVLECDGDTITLVEDYREDIMQCMEVDKHE